MIKTGRVREHLRKRDFFQSAERNREKQSQIEPIEQSIQEIYKQYKRQQQSSETSRTTAETNIAISSHMI